MKINNLKKDTGLKIHDLENGHLFKAIDSGAVGVKVDNHHFYLDLGGRTLGQELWNSIDEDQFEVKDLGKLVSVDEVTVE